MNIVLSIKLPAKKLICAWIITCQSTSNVPTMFHFNLQDAQYWCCIFHGPLSVFLMNMTLWYMHIQHSEVLGEVFSKRVRVTVVLLSKTKAMLSICKICYTSRFNVMSLVSKISNKEYYGNFNLLAQTNLLGMSLFYLAVVYNFHC